MFGTILKIQLVQVTNISSSFLSPFKSNPLTSGFPEIINIKLEYSTVQLPSNWCSFDTLGFSPSLSVSISLLIVSWSILWDYIIEVYYCYLSLTF